MDTTQRLAGAREHPGSATAGLAAASPVPRRKRVAAELGMLLLLGGCGANVPAGNPPSPSPSYLFVWAADADSAQSDFLAVIDATPVHAGYGRIVSTVPVGAVATMAHHTEPEMPTGGILLANGFRAGATFQFDLRDPLRPRLAAPLPVPASFAHAHSFARLTNGHVLATYQYQGEDHAHPGGLVEYDAEGMVVRVSSAADPESREFVRPYSLAVAPAADRVITTGNDMHHEATSRVVQIWRLSDLALLKTVMLPNGPRGDENVNSYEPRVLADGRTALVSTRSCGLYRIVDLEGSDPAAKLVHTFDDSRCFVPAVVGRFWIQALGTSPTLVVLDVSDPDRPREVSRLALEPGDLPHWIAADADGRRLVITGFGGLLHRVLIARFDPRTGAIELDRNFRDKDSELPGIRFDREAWPHGRTGPAVPHGVVFSRGPTAPPSVEAASRQHSYFGQPIPGGTPERFAPGVVSTEAIELNGVFTPEGREFFFTRLIDGIDTMFRSVFEHGRWRDPQPLLVFPGGVRAVAVDMAVSPDGRELYFLGEHPHEYAPENPGYDLWVSRREDGAWSTAQVVPPPVSTSFEELYPVVVADGSLYFTSNRPGGLGRYDLYGAQRQAHGRFAEPLNVGLPISRRSWTTSAPATAASPTPRSRRCFRSTTRRRARTWSMIPSVPGLCSRRPASGIVTAMACSRIRAAGRSASR